MLTLISDRSVIRLCSEQAKEAEKVSKKAEGVREKAFG